MLWLDDIGLPQVRDTFAENLIDGQMLLSLTVQDLVEMKIVSAMNHATIARGIQFLRRVDFNTHRLVKTFTGVSVGNEAFINSTDCLGRSSNESVSG